MGEKWISNNLMAFCRQGEGRARALLKDPARFEIDPQMAQEFADAMQAFRGKLGNGQRGMLSKPQQMERQQAREHAVKILRRIGNLVRSNPRIDDATKMMLDIEPRAKRSGPIPCPQEPPLMRLVRVKSEGSCARTQHELHVSAQSSMRSKPQGADRLDLFFDCIGLNDPVPEYPFHLGRWPKLVGTFFSNQFVVTPDVPEVPMIVLYWARWAGRGDCDFGPFCKTVVGGMVGGMRRFMNPEFGETLNPRAKPRMTIENQTDQRDVTIRIAVLEMQRKMMLPGSFELPDAKQLEGPEEQAA